MSDAALLGCAKGGDREAFGELYARHASCAKKMARSLARSRASAEDLVSDTFARIWQAISHGHGPTEAFGPYMATVMRRAAADQWGRENREVPVGAAVDSGASVSCDIGAALSDRTMVAKAFAGLPERWQTVLWLTEVEGRSPSDLAKVLGVAASTVAMTAFRAREGMREAFLREHLRPAGQSPCGGMIEMMAGYVRDSLSNRDRTKVERHLSGCVSCRSLLGEARSVNATLRSVLWPSAVAATSSWAWLARLRPRGKSAGATAGAAVGAVVAVSVVCVAVAAAAGLGVMQSADGSADAQPASSAPSQPAAESVPPVSVSMVESAAPGASPAVSVSSVPEVSSSVPEDRGGQDSPTGVRGTTSTSSPDSTSTSTTVGDVDGGRPIDSGTSTSTTVADSTSTTSTSTSTTSTTSTTVADTTSTTTSTTIADSTTSTSEPDETTTTTSPDDGNDHDHDHGHRCEVMWFDWCLIPG